jgi:hypothetical protein
MQQLRRDVFGRRLMKSMEGVSNAVIILNWYTAILTTTTTILQRETHLSLGFLLPSFSWIDPTTQLF